MSVSLLQMQSQPNTTQINSDCGPGLYYNGYKCIAIPSPNNCEALFLYTVHDYAHIELIWDEIEYPVNDTNIESNDEIRYIIQYLSEYGTQDIVITGSSQYTITNSFINNHIANYTDYYHNTIATISTIFNYNTQTNQYPLSSISNVSTNCTFIIPSLTTPSPTESTVAILSLNGTFCKNECQQNEYKHITQKYDEISEIETILNHTYIIRNPIDNFPFDISLNIEYCYNRTYEEFCEEYQDIFSSNVSIRFELIPFHHEFEAITLRISHCEIIYDNNDTSLDYNYDSDDDYDYDCSVGSPQSLTLRLSETNTNNNNNTSFDYLTIWWFWVLLGLSSTIILCILCLFGLMIRHKKLRKRLFVARNDLHFQQKDNNQLLDGNTKDMVKNPLGTGIPNSLPIYDPIEDEIKQRAIQQENIRTGSYGHLPFEYKISMKPKTGKKKKVKEDKPVFYDTNGNVHKWSDSTDTEYSNVQEMIELDNKGRKKVQVWRTSYEEPLLQ